MVHFAVEIDFLEELCCFTSGLYSNKWLTTFVFAEFSFPVKDHVTIGQDSHILKMG